MKLRVPEVEKAFLQVAIDLKEILVLDGIDQLADPPGFRIRSHDLYGSLPDILIEDTGDRYPVLDKLEREAAKLTAMVRVRNDLAGMFPGCEFLLPRARTRVQLLASDSMAERYWPKERAIGRHTTGS